jgi:hypothetical protein
MAAMTKRIIVRDTERRPTWGRALFDGALPLDVVFAGAEAARRRPGILSRKGDEEDELELKEAA